VHNLDAIFAWLLVEPSCAQPNFGRSGIVTIRELSFWRDSMPRMNLLILKVYNPLSAGNPFGVGLMNAILLQDLLLSCFHEHIVQCGFVVNQWKIAWSLTLQHSSGGSKFFQISYTLQVLLFADGCPFVTFSKANIGAFHSPAYVVIWGSCGMNLGQGKLSWDPGIRAPLWFFRFVAQAAAQGWIMVEALTHRYSHYTTAFLDQALFSHDYYINFVQFHSNHIYDNFRQHYEASNIKESHVPWDPGGSTFHRLGVKPNFMEGGLSATLSILSLGRTMGCQLLGLGLLEYTKGLQITKRGGTNGRLGQNGRLRPGWRG
jgi:hypothetical protein